ncbi:outer membrane beta-barrel protein [Salmonirosea aquatica]|uniref:Outer membrane beta-barrel protein n=1 Tax=Salmonirosea aquatica TaxID=2654236 RepID=A0A7C9F3U0_9BACT|nr:outer membrane beta-barrel protein [Cytophagaceae bacterium SJW1-29]
MTSPTLIALTKSSRKNASQEVDQIITGSSTAPLRTPALTRSIALLTPVGPSEVDVYMQKRYMHYRYDVVEPTLPKRSRARELWAGLGIMPASFNPQVNVTSSPMAFTNANASRQALASTSKARLSYAMQVQGGKKLSKRWSVETGLSYLQGNSTFESDGYVLNAFTSRSANVLEDALLSSSNYANSAVQQPGFAPNFDKSSASYIDLDQRTSNDYRYVQVPVQAGYTLNPDGKMNYTVLAGVVGNLFLQNEIQSAQGYSFKNTADDGLYRSLNWSAATGLRVNYRMSDHWNASLTGSYQKAIASILRDSPTLDSRPRLYGMAWGVQYIF